MLTTVEGLYRAGEIKLLEVPNEAPEGRVLVVFLGQPAEASASKPMTFGQFSGAEMSTEEDFKIAEWRGEEEFDDNK